MPRMKAKSPEKKKLTHRHAMKRLRQKDTQEQAQARLAAARQGMQMLRHGEESRKKEERRATQKQTKRKQRADESPAMKQSRLASCRQRMAKLKVEETPESALNRRSLDRLKKVMQRASESETVKQSRLASCRQTMKKLRAEETPEAALNRRSSDRLNKGKQRASESETVNLSRLASCRQTMKKLRAEETSEAALNRRSSDRLNKGKQRASESQTVKLSRLASCRQTMKTLRAEATPEAALTRRTSNRLKKATQRALEFEAEKQSRLASCRQRMAKLRAEKRPQSSRKCHTVQRWKSDQFAQCHTEINWNTQQQPALNTPDTPTPQVPQTLQRESQQCDVMHDMLLMDNQQSEVMDNMVTVDESSKLFLLKVKEGPIYPCCSCQRLLYRSAVRQMNDMKYDKTTVPIDEMLRLSINFRTHDKHWVCTTCHNALKKGQIPTQSCMNGLTLDEVPPELEDLRPLEQRLISQRIPFMKLVGLPRGGQKAIHGSAVNVPSKLDSITSLLPRLPQTAEVVPLKLKRKLSYKGHYMYEYIRPQKVMQALRWLQQNNPLYKDIEICENWVEEWQNDDAELWEALAQVNPDITKQDDTSSAIENDLTSDIQPQEQQNIATGKMISTETDEAFAVPAHNVCNNASQQPPTLPSGNPYETLQYVATRHHFAIRNVPGDGNCFFHAVSDSLLNAGVQHTSGPELRSQLITFLQDSEFAEEYAQFLVQPGAPTGKEVAIIHESQSHRQLRQLSSYISGLQHGAWADNLAVQGTADMLNINIRVINTITPDFIHDIHPRRQRGTNTITIGLIGELHYVSLEKNESRPQHNIPNERQEIEDREDEIAYQHNSELRGMPYDTLLQEEQLSQDNTYSVSPGENQIPRSFLLDEYFEELANPSKYPYGNGGLSKERSKKITPRKYFNQRLLHADGRFAKDIDYLLAAQYAVESKQIKDDISISLRQTRGQTFRNRRVNAGLMKCSENVQAMIRTDTAFKFLKQVRGSPSYWKVVLLDLLAMVRQLGIPTWFLTLSAADMQWPEVIQSIARQYGSLLTDEDVKNMSWEEKCKWLRCNPVTAARQFQHRLDLFFKDFLNAKSNPIGDLQDYMIRVEFQARGSPHAHTILWIKDAPKLDVNSHEEITSFIDKYQTCSIPQEEGDLKELVTSLQKHVHSAACRRHGTCRFRFPHPPSKATLIARPSPESDHEVSAQQMKETEQILGRVRETMDNKLISENVSLEDLLQTSDVTLQQYQQALGVTKTGLKIVLNRLPCERWINQYNPHILRTWRANMDLQFVTDAYSCIMYITSYMLKSERSMSELLKRVADECREDDIKTKLKKVGSAFLNNREVSCQEAAYRLLSLPLKKATRKVVFVNTMPKDKRVSMLKPLSVLQDMDDDADDIFCTSLNDRYSSRPDALENICMAEFAATYTASATDEDDPGNNILSNSDVCENNVLPQIIQLKNGLGCMKKRKRHCVIRFHKEKTEGEEKYRNLIMLYHPWRDEDQDLLSTHPTYKDHYLHVSTAIQENQAKFSQNTENIEQAIDDLENIGPPEHAWDAVAPGAEYDQAQQEAEGIVFERELHLDDSYSNVDLASQSTSPRSELHARFSAELAKTLMTPSEYRAMMRSLNAEQMEVMKLHRKWCKDMIIALKNNRPTPAYQIFLSGPGGVGKSHVIKLVHYETMRLLKPLSGHFEPEDLPLLLTAYTGTAAFGIDGMTLHSAFSFSCGPNSKRQYQPLSNEKLNTLRSRLGKLKLLVIDEISMVGSDMLYHIHRRLQDITGSSDPNICFGGTSILAVGDLYQLQPVGMKHVFELPSDSYARLYGSLWEENFQMKELTQSMRQHEDQQFAQLLMRVRTATCTKADIALLKSRELSKDDENYPVNALHVFRLNEHVDAHNTEHIKNLSTKLYEIQAIDKKKDVHTGLIDVAISEKPSDTGGLRKVLSVATGARVMVTTNIDVSDGLANGVCGTVVDIHHTGDEVHTILVEFDSLRVGRQAIANSQYKGMYPDAVPIKRLTVQFYTGRGRTSVEAKRMQFPLTLAWACTIHKVQGKTLESIVVSMHRGGFSPGQAYVAFSRVKRLSGLYILHFNASAIRVNPAVHAEMERLKHCSIPPCPMPVSWNTDGQTVAIGLLNVRSLLPHVADLKADPVIQMMDVFCFVETHLTENQLLTESTHILPDKQIFRTERPSTLNVAGGGIMILVSNALTPKRLTFRIPDLEYTGVTVMKNSTAVNIIVIYRPPLMSSPLFTERLVLLIESLDRTVLTVILGDFNYDLLQHPQHSILQLMRNFGFHQCVSYATTDYGSLLDHVYLNGPSPAYVDVVDTYYSDHDIVCFPLAI